MTSNWEDAKVAQVTFDANGGNYDGNPQTITQATIEETEFSVTLPTATGAEGSTLLAWYSNLGTPQYGLPGESMTFHWADITETNNEVPVTAKWLNVMFAGTENTDWSGEATITSEDTYFTVTAPETAPEEEGKFFLGWTVIVGEQTFEEVQAGEQIDAVLEYATYADQTVTFTVLVSI